MINFDYLLTKPKFEAFSQAAVKFMKKMSVFEGSILLKL